MTQQDGTLTVAYEDLPWKGFLKWLDRKGWRRSAVVTLAVPAGTSVEVGVVGAAAVVSGMENRVAVRGVRRATRPSCGSPAPSGAETVSGSLEAQAVSGDLRFNSVSGDLTVVEASGCSVRAESASGSMIVLPRSRGTPTDVQLSNVSGRSPSASRTPRTPRWRPTSRQRHGLQRLRGPPGQRPVGRQEDHRPTGRGQRQVEGDDRLRLHRHAPQADGEDEPREDGSSASPETPTDKKVL